MSMVDVLLLPWVEAVAALREGWAQSSAFAIVGLVFLWSGASKVLSPSAAANAMMGFGITRRPGLRLALLVGATEMTLGAAAVAPAGLVRAVAVAGLAGGSAVMASLVARALITGRSFPCGCFGEDEPVGLLTLVRVVALFVLAVLALSGGVTPPWKVEDIVVALAVVASAALLTRLVRIRGQNAHVVSYLRESGGH